jgi:cytoskeleton protein RodZ
VPDALSVQPAAGASPEQARTSSVGTGPGAPQPADRVVDDRPAPSAAGAGPEIAATVGSARQVLSAIDPSLGGPDAPQVHERGNADARVILRARERAWIQVSSPAGDYTFTRTLEPGEVLLVPNRADLELWTGNAGGLEVVVDGTAVPALAGGGAVRRHVSLDPDRLLQAAAQTR